MNCLFKKQPNPGGVSLPSLFISVVMGITPFVNAESATAKAEGLEETSQVKSEVLLIGEGMGLVEGSPLRSALIEELERNRRQLTLPDAPPIYHLRYHLLDLLDISATTSYGDIIDLDRHPVGVLGVEVRVGSPSFDNTGYGGWETGFNQAGLPRILSARALKQVVWRSTDWAYKEAVEQYARKKSAFQAPPDYPGDFQILPSTKASQVFAKADSEQDVVDLARSVSAAMPTHPVLRRSAVLVAHEVGGAWIVDSEGTDVTEPISETVVRAVAHHVADDGMLLTDHRTWMVRRLADLPPLELMAQAAKDMVNELVEMTTAEPLDEEYVGPVLFEESAAADLFRTLLVPQFEGTPPPIPFESQFGLMNNTGMVGSGRPGDVRIGRRVLPAGWSVLDDPRLDRRSSASFNFDVEGTEARKVNLVTDGIVRTLLMSRTPRKGVEGTNGHARGGPGHRPTGRAAMTIVQPDKHLARSTLHKRAIRLARAYERDYVLLVRRFQDDSIRSLESGSPIYLESGGKDTMSLPIPLMIYRLHADGREVPLRGAVFSGENRFVLRDIAAAGPQVNQMYLAPFSAGSRESNPLAGLPTYISAPEILVGEMELMPIPSDPRDLPVVPPPGASP